MGSKLWSCVGPEGLLQGFWGRFGLDLGLGLGLIWGRSAVALGVVWGRAGAGPRFVSRAANLWGVSGIELGADWRRSRLACGRLGVDVGVLLGSI